VTQTIDAGRYLRPGLLIGGAELGSASGGSFDHVNPATGQVQQSVVMAGKDEVDQAVAAARAGQAEWRSWKPEERRRVLTRIADSIREHAEELSFVMALENGIPVGMARDIMVPLGADWFEYAASWADKLDGQVVPTDAHTFDYTLIEPIGVVAVVLTWNGPVGSWGMCVAPPLAAGCSVIVKPSELAPFSSLLIGRLCMEAGLPAGVVNVLPGSAEAGAALVGHPGVDKVSFTGGGATGRKIAVACAENLKPMLLELGGKSANIVFEDADLAKAVPSAISIIGLAGQGCTLPSRLLVQDSIYDQFIEMVAGALSQIPVGDPLDPNVFMGPVVNSNACDRILGMIERAQNDGGKILSGGARLDGELAGGYFIPPTLVGDVDPTSEIAREEVFGPVVAAIRFTDEEDAIRIANDSKYGLAGYVHTKDISRALRVAGALETGSIGVNGGGAPGPAGAPFGGVKESGYGREGGIAGVLEFTRAKNVMVDIS